VGRLGDRIKPRYRLRIMVSHPATSSPDAWRTAPSLAEIELLAYEALTTIPDELRRHVSGVVIRVEDFPDDEIAADMELESPFDLLGLYTGVSLDHKSISDTPIGPDMIFLYRRPILDYWCESGETLARLVRHVLIHEIGHHFGFSDDDMTRIEEDANADL
jgi:predicted Zn-dependent protease with MMP-like domain